MEISTEYAAYLAPQEEGSDVDIFTEQLFDWLDATGPVSNTNEVAEAVACGLRSFFERDSGKFVGSFAEVAKEASRFDLDIQTSQAIEVVFTLREAGFLEIQDNGLAGVEFNPTFPVEPLSAEFDFERFEHEFREYTESVDYTVGDQTQEADEP